jgi:hypothetical protein
MPVTYKMTIGDHYYYGSCKNFSWRRKVHRRNLRKGIHTLKVQQVYDECGEYPKFDLIDKFDNIDDARRAEQELLDNHFDDDFCMNAQKIASPPQ